MKFLKLKNFAILLFFIILILGFNFFTKNFIQKNIIDNIIKFQTSNDNFNFAFKKIKVNLLSITPKIEIQESYLNFENNKKNLEIEENKLAEDLEKNFYKQIYIPLIKLDISFFQIIKYIFSKKINIKKIILENPDMNFNFEKSQINKIIDLSKNHLSNNDISIEIINGYLKLTEKKENSNQVFEKINGFIKIDKSLNVKSQINLTNNSNEYKLNTQISRKKNNSNNYELKANILNGKNNLNYNAELTLNDQQGIENLNGEIDASGDNFTNFSKIFCSNCSNNECSLGKNDFIKLNEKNINFSIKAKTNFNKKESNFLKIENIRFFIDKKDNEIIGLIFYDIVKKKIYTNFKIKNLNFKSENLNQEYLYDDVNILIKKINNFLESEVFFIKFYLNFLKKNNSENNIEIVSANLNEYIVIENLKTTFSTDKDKFNIKNFETKLNKIYTLNIKNNPNQSSGNFNIILNKNGSNYFNCNGKFLPSSILIEAFSFNENDGELQEKQKTKIFGNFELKFHSKSNFGYARINLENIVLEQFSEKFKKNKNYQELKKYFTFTSEDSGGDFIKKILFFIQRYNLFYDVELNFKNLVYKNQNFETLKTNFFIQNNKINLSLKTANAININSILMFKNYLPYIDLEISINDMSLNSFKEKFLNYKLFLNELEFKAIDSSTIWRNINFNIKPIKDLDFKLKLNAKNILFNKEIINSIDSNIDMNNNLLKVKNFDVQMKDDSGAKFSINLDLKKMFFDGSFRLSNLYLKNILTNNAKDDNAFIKDLKIDSIGKFTSIGSNLIEFIQNFNANIKYNAYDVILNKLDLDNFIKKFNDAEGVNKLISLSEQSVVIGETLIDGIQGNVEIRNNLIENNFQILTRNFNGAGSINMFLKNSAFNGLVKIAFFTPDELNKFNIINIKLNGNLFNINKKFDLSSLTKKDLPKQ